MADQTYSTGAADDDALDALPSDPHIALFLAFLYRRLGGSFSISSNGGRYFGRPEPCAFRIKGQELPQLLPHAKPHEQFRNADEWRGAIKSIEALLQRLDDEDTNLIFDLLAAAPVDERSFVPTIEEPKRWATGR